MTLANPGPNALPGLTLTDPLPGGAGVDWTIANQQGPATCTITGAPPSETLGCGTFTLAAGQSQTVHVTSPTAAGVCAVLDNTATATSPIAGSGTGQGSVTVQCTTAVTTTPSAVQVSPGTPIHDTVVVTDGNVAPTGTVTFALYGPGDTTCQTNLVSGPGFVDVPLSPTGATSGDFVPTTLGLYQWVVSYGGDPLHRPSAGTCADASEQVGVVSTLLTKTADGAERLGR